MKAQTMIYYDVYARLDDGSCARWVVADVPSALAARALVLNQFKQPPRTVLACVRTADWNPPMGSPEGLAA